MIIVAITKDKNGCLKAFNAAGHGGVLGRKGDILCAAVTVILRTTARLIYANPNIESEGSKGNPGEMRLSILSYNQKEGDWLKGITDFCVTGLNDLKLEYPEKIVIKYT